MTGPACDLADPEHLARSNLWQCAALARRLTRVRPWDRDEAESVALVALAEAVREFDPYRDTPNEPRADHFPSFAGEVIRHRVINFLRSQAPKGYRFRNGVRRAGTPQLHQLDQDAEEIGLAPASEPPVGWAIEWEDFVRALSRKLPPRHGEVLRLRYLHADSESAAGAMARMGLKEWRICHLHRESLAMLREKFHAKGA